MSEIKLQSIFSDSDVRDFAAAIRKSIRPPKIGNQEKWPADYASLVEIQYAETPNQFTEILWKFMRRYDVIARKHGLIRPTENNLEKVVKLIDLYGVKPVRAALIAHALVKSSKEEADNDGSK